MNEPLRVLIAGGGIASLELILALRDLAGDHVDLEAIARDTGTRIHYGSLAAVAPGRRVAVTGTGAEMSYDALVVATGARRQAAVPGALTLASRAAFAEFGEMLGGLGRERSERVVFAVPGGVTWALPAYELALLTATWLEQRGDRRSVSLTLVTPEDEPLGVFGLEVAAAIADLLELRGIELRTGIYPAAFSDAQLAIRPGEPIDADHVVALPRLAGPAIPGLPSDEDGFLPADPNGRVDRFKDIYAAGDATAFPVKQGGIATQQADAIARSIASAAGADVKPEPFDPVLRGLLLTGQEPSYLRAELAGGRGTRSSEYQLESPWWPPAKVVGRYLSHYLASRAADQPPIPDAPFLRIETDDLEPYLKNRG